MKTNNHKIVDFDAVLDAKFGMEGKGTYESRGKRIFLLFWENPAKRTEGCKNDTSGIGRKSSNH